MKSVIRGTAGFELNIKSTSTCFQTSCMADVENSIHVWRN